MKEIIVKPISNDKLIADLIVRQEERKGHQDIKMCSLNREEVHKLILDLCKLLEK